MIAISCFSIDLNQVDPMNRSLFFVPGLALILSFGAFAQGNTGTQFCASNANSTGSITTLTGSFATFSRRNLHLEVSAGVPFEVGYVLVGPEATSGALISNGRLCLVGTATSRIYRYNVAGGESNSLGRFDSAGVMQNLVGTSLTGSGFDVPNTVPDTTPITIMSGDTWNFQVWHRDTAAGLGSSNFSSGLSVTFGPPQPVSGMLPISAGTFSMGSDAATGSPYFGDMTTQPLHDVTLSRNFWIGRYEVSQSEYLALMGTNPSGSIGMNLPVENVSWADAKAYCAALMAQETAQGSVPAGYEYRLPTEAEWEFACRSGTATEFSSGSALVCADGNFAFSYHSGNFCNIGGIEPVGSYPANAWGLHDMHGNVWEWCLDGYSAYTSAAATDPYIVQGADNILRGGSWAMESDRCRSGYRRNELQGLQAGDVGFRVVLGPILSLVTSITLPNGGEGFGDAANENGPHSGASWGLNSRLVTNLGGGSGRLGGLVVPAGQTLILNTDSQDFPIGTLPNLIGNSDLAGDFPTTLTVTDGVFEFSRLTIQPGGVLRLVGSNPARILVRGEVDIAVGAVIDLSGASGGLHDSTTLQPEVTLASRFPMPAAGAGSGGWGADRYDFDQVGVNPNVFIAIGGVDIDEAVPEINDGRDGQGLGSGAVGKGLGGLMNHLDFPTENTIYLAPNFGLGAHGVGTVFPLTNWFNGADANGCRVLCIGTSGSGGGYAIDGGDAINVAPEPLATLPLGDSNNGLVNLGGVAPALAAPSVFNSGYSQRTLDWTQGYLLGGSGGGGGGLHPYRTRTQLGFFQSCPGALNDTLRYDLWKDHSGARGGDGGGALHLAAGKRIRINGDIRLGGGDGGSSSGGNALDPGRFAMPGGGGSGGALRLQGDVVQVSSAVGRIDVSGGSGGLGSWALSVFGGGGSMGLVRIETGTSPMLHEDVAPSIWPYNGDGQAPFDNLDKSLDFLSVDSGGFVPQIRRPDSICASVSCWIELPGSFTSVEFAQDDVSAPGWDMDVLWQSAGTETVEPFRAASTTFGASGFEGIYGNLLGNAGLAGSPIVVRFQGARTIGALPDPCDVTLDGGSSPIIPGTLTTWVDHPAKLNGSGVNIIRYTIMFDNTMDPGNGDTPGVTLNMVNGITNLVIHADAQ